MTPKADLSQTLLNSAFSKALPGMQLAVDSLSLGEFKICPRRYYYAIVCGWEPKARSVHLTFGLLVHEVRERYDRLRAKGASHDEALLQVFRWGLRKTWNRGLGRPWISEHPEKNRLSFLRTIVWYLDAYGAEDALKTILDSAGEPLVELKFQFDSGYATLATKEQILLCGFGDRIATLGEGTYWVDSKTTAHALSPSYFKGFSPHNQFSLYTLAGRVVWKQPLQGLIVDAIQVGAGFTRCKRVTVERAESHSQEWLEDLGRWLKAMEECALEQDWPMNDAVCGLYGGCKFQSVCAMRPALRQMVLNRDFDIRIWNPLLDRED